jgi:acetyltransferase
MAVDSLLARSGSLAELSRDTVAALDEILPAAWSHGNPVDILGDAPPQRYADAIAPVLADRAVDAVLVVLAPQAMTDPAECARALSPYARQTRKPLLAAWMGGEAVREGREVLHQAGIPVYETPEGAIEAFTHLVSYARNLETLYETPRDILPEAWAAPRRLEGWPPETGADGILGERESKRLLRAYGIRSVMPERASSAEAAVRVARSMGYPVVLKIDSPDISHKTDVGGVVLDIRGDDSVRRTYGEIVAAASDQRPGARIDGVFIEPMVRVNDGIELILGSKRDATFGAIVLVGLGGVSAELFRDFALELPPVNERLARRMLHSLHAWPLLRGYRERPAVDIDALVEAIVRFSYLVAEHPEVTEIDVNPLLATPRGVTALDARMVLQPAEPQRPPYAHLAIRPYPEHYVHEDYLRDGTPVTYRPIKPEDEPMWHRLLSSCSEDSIRARFFSVIKEFTHEIAARFCFIDYEREMAIVAEVETAGRRELIAVGRMVADPDHEAAEFAILIGDDWQGLGLGNKLTGYCLQVAEQWGIDWIYATTLKNNVRMLAIFEDYGFTTRPDIEEGVVDAMRPIGTAGGKEPPPWQRVLKERSAVS